MDFVIRRQSERIENFHGHKGDQSDQDFDFPALEWLHLRAECEIHDINTFYETYVQRLRRNYLALFLIVHTILGTINLLVYLVSNYDNEVAFEIKPEMFAFIVTVVLVWVLLSSSLNDSIVERHPRLPFIMSCVTLFALVLTDISVPLYNCLSGSDTALRPTYEMYILLLVYIFLPITNNTNCFVLGALTSICYILEMWFVTNLFKVNRAMRTVTELIFVVCINFFGIFFRLMIEVAIRRAFLDRRVYVESNVLLKLAREQVQNLILSILPAHIAKIIETDIRDMIKTIREEKSKPPQTISPKNPGSAVQPIQRCFRGQTSSKLYVEHHTDVSILYADIVNYTFMTTKLPVKVLVETLHELFVKFDQASEENNVLRIKFLGDCYYCVAGVPERNDRHAKSCVDLGLQMIADIRAIRATKSINIDMRIGVHSGSIMSGVIGACKWQYDIWSQDATIANRMESTGEPGKVHVTKQTLDHLDNGYIFEMGTSKAKLDRVLQRYGIETFLISPQIFAELNPVRSMENLSGSPRKSIGVQRMIARSSHMSKSRTNNAEKSAVAPRTNFMRQNSMEQYHEVRKQIKEEMANELDQISIGAFQLTHIVSVLSKALLCFRDGNYEWAYMGEPDLILKFSTLMGLVILLAIVSMQKLTHTFQPYHWMVHGASMFALTTFVVITWFKKLWIIFRSTNDGDSYTADKPRMLLVKWMFVFSRNVIRNPFARSVIYLVTVVLLTISSLIPFADCPTHSNLIVECIRPWIVTECVVLALCVNFIFVRVYFVIKLFIGFLIVGLYGWLIFVEFKDLFHTSTSTSDSISPKMAHIVFVMFILIIFHIVDRQTEYISRVDFSWKRQLIKKQEEAEFTKDTINVLIRNILPSHVAEIYMKSQIKDELYYEEYENVAIMFATITNFDEPSQMESLDHERNVLSILNKIICDFDEELVSHISAVKIEKIKVAGWTYMVACGLDPGRTSSSVIDMRDLKRTSLASNGRRSWNTSKLITITEHPSAGSDSHIDPNRPTSRKTRNPTYVITNFALHLMRVLDNFNQENFMSKGKLRIGISHGKVMAGVVGSSKPLYDVWGNAVNMASRMDSTGQPGCIHVNGETAIELRSVGIECWRYRQETEVKGHGKIPTYFVCVDKNKFQFIRCGEIGCKANDEYDLIDFENTKI